MRTPLLLLAAIVAACHVDRAPNVERVSESAAACENLRKLDCSEGYGAPGGEPCAIILDRAVELRPLPVACWTSAKDRAEARACGALACQVVAH